MCRISGFVFCMSVMSLTPVGLCADLYWAGSNAGGNNIDFDDPLNWSLTEHTVTPNTGPAPRPNDSVIIKGDSGNGSWPVIQHANGANAYHIFIGFSNQNAIPEITVDSTSTLTVINNGIHVGFVDDAALNTAGTVNTGLSWLCVGEGNEWGYGHGIVNITGGAVTTAALSFGTYNSENYEGGTGIVNLIDGYLVADDIRHLETPGCQINIQSGTLVINGDRTSDVDLWDRNGYLVAYSNNGYIIRDYDISNPSKTTITACDISSGDLVQDCKIDLLDYATLANLWQGNLSDLQIVAGNWLRDEQNSYPHGLTVNPVGTLQNNGKKFRGYAVNFFDAFYRTLIDGNDTSYDQKLAILTDYDIPLTRICGCGFWAIDNQLYLNDKEEYFRRFDTVVASAEQHGIGLIPSLFWAYWTVPDIVEEPCNRWGQPDSQTIAYMRSYVQDVLTRYKDSPAIWGWECGNEWNLSADLPNAADHRPPIWPQLGTPIFRSAEDDMSHEIIVYALSEIAKEIRKYDSDHMISSGNTDPRPSAWNQWQYLTWDTDTPAQHAEMLARQNPDPINTVSIHYYEQDYDINFAMSTAVSLKKPLFVGEFGVQDGPEKTSLQVEQEFNTMLNMLINENVPLSAIWVYERDVNDGWNITSTNSRSYQLDAIQQANP